MTTTNLGHAGIWEQENKQKTASHVGRVTRQKNMRLVVPAEYIEVFESCMCSHAGAWEQEIRNRDIDRRIKALIVSAL